MKKMLLAMLVMVSFLPISGKAEFSSTKSRLYIPISQFRDSDGLTALGSSVTGTAGYYAYPSATAQSAIYIPTQQAGVGCTITASFYTPNDLAGGWRGNGRLFALVHLSGETNTATLGATTIQSSAFGSLTVTTAYTGLTTGLGLAPIPSTAFNQIVRYELQTVSSTVANSGPIIFQPNRLVYIKIYNVGILNKIIEFYGLIFEYTHDPKLKR